MSHRWLVVVAYRTDAPGKEPNAAGESSTCSKTGRILRKQRAIGFFAEIARRFSRSSFYPTEYRGPQRLPCVADGENNGAHDMPVTSEVGRDGRGRHSDNHRHACGRTQRHQQPGGNPSGGPEYGHAIQLGQQEKAHMSR